MVDAVRCAIELQHGMIERNAGLPSERRIEFRVGIHLGDVVEEADGDLMGEGVNVAARLEGIAEPGAICLSEQAYWQVRGRLDLAAADLGPIQLKNIAEPIRVYSLRVGVDAQRQPETAVKPAALKRRLALVPLVAALVASLILIGGGARWVLAGEGSTPPGAARLSIVVLPFTNLSNDPAQDYFADGVTENLTTELSRLHNSFVISRNTAFTFKGKNLDAKAIGKELGVRYVLEGSVQRDQNRVLVNAELIDTESDAQVWADRFEDDVGVHGISAWDIEVSEDTKQQGLTITRDGEPEVTAGSPFWSGCVRSFGNAAMCRSSSTSTNRRQETSLRLLDFSLACLNSSLPTSPTQNPRRSNCRRRSPRSWSPSSQSSNKVRNLSPC